MFSNPEILEPKISCTQTPSNRTFAMDDRMYLVNPRMYYNRRLTFFIGSIAVDERLSHISDQTVCKHLLLPIGRIEAFDRT